MKRTLPVHVTAYARSKEFDATSVPDKFLSHHDLKAGTWGRLQVMAGGVTFFTEGEDEPLAVLRSVDELVICPEERHYVQLSDDAVFFVEFYK